MKAKKKFQPQRKNLERRLASYGLASGALLATGAVAQADVIVWDSSNSGLPQQTSLNDALHFSLVSGTTSNGYFPGAQFRLANSFSSTNGTDRTYYYTKTTAGSYIRHTNSFPFHNQRSQAYGYRDKSYASFRGNGLIYRLYSGSTVGPGQYFTGVGRMGKRRSHTGGYPTGNTGSTSYGPWNPDDSAYIGLSFNDATGRHFGWAQIALDSNFRITLQSMAYETIPDRAIAVGQVLDPLQILSVVSRKFHDGQPHDIPLPLTGDPGVECRQPGMDNPTRSSRPSGSSFGRHTLIVKFTNAMASGDASITGGTGNIDSTFFPGDNTMEIDLGAVDNAQRITVKLSNVTDHNGFVLDDTEVSMDVLLGDTTANRAVNSSDVSETQAESGHAVGANFRDDITVDGQINSSDVSAAQTQSGTAIPDPPPRAGKKTGRAIAPAKRARSER